MEGSESFTATISTANTGFASVSAGDDDTATVNIVDNDGVIVQFNPTQYSVTEGDGEVELTLVASAAASFNYVVKVDTVDGTAVGQLFEDPLTFSSYKLCNYVGCMYIIDLNASHVTQLACCLVHAHHVCGRGLACK